MKTIILSLITIFSATTFAQDNTIDLDRNYGASLDKYYSEHDFMDNVDTGYVEVNQTENTITLTLNHNFECPEGQICARVMPLPTIITLPIEEVEVNDCNIVIYTAVADNTPVDGIKEVIQVSDNTKNICPTFVALEPTQVVYSTYNPWVNDTEYSAFNGKQLKLLPVNL